MSETGRRALELRLFLERFVSERPDEPLAWIAVPAEASFQTLGAARALAPVAGEEGRVRPRAVARASVKAARDDAAPGTGFWLAGDALFEADGVNHRRALEPVIGALGESRRLEGQARARSRRVARLTRRAVALADELLRAAREEDLWLAREPADVRSIFASVARYLAHAEALLEAHRPCAAVVASTTNIAPRALLVAARAAAVPSLFFPHAPVLRDPFFNDLPVDAAGLRGEREADLLAGWGAPRERIEVVGDPSMEERATPAIDGALAPVFAPPVNPPELLPALFDLVHGVLGDDVTVSPHPRADLELVRSLMPDRWILWEGRTAALLEQGPPLLLQHSSGVALEALRLGVPVVELTQPVWPTTYAAIEEPHVTSASSPDGLRDAVAAARRDAADHARRSALVAWARGWSCSDDRTPARAAELVRATAERGTAAGPIWDAWRADPAAVAELPRLTGS